MATNRYIFITVPIKGLSLCLMFAESKLQEEPLFLWGAGGGKFKKFWKSYSLTP